MRISAARNIQPLLLLLPLLLLTVLLTHPAVGFRGLDVVDATLRHRPHYPLLQFTAATSFQKQPLPSTQLFHSSPKKTSGEDRGGNNNNNINNLKKKKKGTKFNSKFQRPKRQQRRPGGRDRNKNQNPEIQRNRNIISLGKTFNWEAILNLYRKESTDFSFINYSTTMVQLGRIISLDKKNPIFLQFMEDLATNIENRGLDWMGIQGISNIVYSIGKMGLQNKSAERIFEFTTESRNANIIGSHGNQHDIANICWGIAKLKEVENFSSFLSHVEPHLERLFEDRDMKPQDASNLAYACAESGVQSPKLFELIERKASWLVEDGNAQAISNTAWACATLGYQSPNLFAAIEKHSTWLVENGNPQEISITVWACSTLGYQSPNLFAAIEKHSTWLVENGTPQNLANTAWACATLGYQSPNLFAAIETRTTWLVENGTPQAVANTAWACATLGYQSPNLFAAIETRTTWLVENGTPQAVANTAWACATLGIRSPKLFEAIEKQATWLVENGNPQEITNTVWACSTLGYQSPNLFAAIEKHSTWLVENGNAQNVANTAWAFAKQAIPSTEFFQSFIKNLETILKSSKSQDIESFCFSIAVLDLMEEYEEGFRMLWSKALSLDPRRIPTKGWSQLVQTYLFVTAAGLEIEKPTIPPGMSTGKQMASSSSQNEISELLTEIGFEHEQRFPPITDNYEELSSFVPEGFLSIHFASPERKIAIGLNGPSRYLIDLQTGERSSLEDGPTKAKRRFLERIGWKVYCIRYSDWIHESTEEAKLDLLREILDFEGE